MLGAIAGDIFGSTYEFDGTKDPDIDLFARHRFFTDDTVLTIATADALLTDGDYTRAYREWGRRYPICSWGLRFHGWLTGDDPRPYNSFGNGSAMRVSPVGWAFEALDETLAEAERSAAVSHNHPEGIKGAQATAAAIFLARTGAAKEEIRREITDRFGYDLNRAIADIRPTYHFDETCQGSVPEALIAFLDADDFAHTLRLAISLGGDADTQAAIACAVAEAFWAGIPPDIQAEVNRILPPDMLLCQALGSWEVETSQLPKAWHRDGTETNQEFPEVT
jgi:ADP-ribosylglycohydrolase